MACVSNSFFQWNWFDQTPKVKIKKCMAKICTITTNESKNGSRSGDDYEWLGDKRDLPFAGWGVPIWTSLVTWCIHRLVINWWWDASSILKTYETVRFGGTLLTLPIAHVRRTCWPIPSHQTSDLTHPYWQPPIRQVIGKQTYPFGQPYNPLHTWRSCRASPLASVCSWTISLSLRIWGGLTAGTAAAVAMLPNTAAQMVRVVMCIIAAGGRFDWCRWMIVHRGFDELVVRTAALRES